MNRRLFVYAFTATAASYRRIYGANERLGIALIGAGQRGRQVAKAASRAPDVELRVLCDVYDARLQQTRATVPAAPGIMLTSTHEEALAAPGVDAVIVATPDHTHFPIAQAALAAGKHVYLETPAVHRFEEAQLLSQAVKSAGKVCQIGVQQRSASHYRALRETYLEPGKLGRIAVIRASSNNHPALARTIPNAPKPEGLDWARFLGPAPQNTPYETARYENWPCYPEYSAGLLGNGFNHHADSAQWLMEDFAPRHAVALGGIYELADGRRNPDTINAIVQYKDWNLTFESTILSVREERPGLLLEGDEATLFVARDGYVFTPHKGEPVEVAATEDLDQAHMANFLAAIRTGAAPSAGVEAGIRGLLPCHMARAAYDSGKRVSYHEDTNQITAS